jgi:FixJ family two-component response regulator
LLDCEPACTHDATPARRDAHLGSRCHEAPRIAWQKVSTITIVEDDSSLNLAVSRLLEAAGFDTRCFTSAGALLADQDACNADCLVLDIHLPDMSGFDLQRRLAAAGSTTPVIVITAHDDPMHRRAARDIGAYAYLTKPFSSVSLLDAVTRAAAASSG